MNDFLMMLFPFYFPCCDLVFKILIAYSPSGLYGSENDHPHIVFGDCFAFYS